MHAFFYYIALLFLLAVPSASFAAALSVSPSAGSYTVGDTIALKVYVASPDASINAVSGVLKIPSIFSVESISKSSSVLNFWPSDPVVAQNIATFEGVSLSGFQGSPGTIVSLILRATRAGAGDVIFQSGQVLANDGKGTDVTAGLFGGTFTAAAARTPASSTPKATVPPAPRIVPKEESAVLIPIITSSTHPDSTQWYSRSHVILDWTNAQGVTAVRLGYDKNADGSPTVLYSDPISHKELDLTDGIWYFHVREKGPDGWGPVGTFRIQIDTVPPLPINLQFPNGTSTEGALAVSFATDDELSGMSHYQLTVDGTPFSVSAEEGSSTYTLPAQSPGIHALVVTGYDKAGNKVVAQGSFVIIENIVASTETLFSWGWLAVNYLSIGLIVLMALGVLLFGGWYIVRNFYTFHRRASGKADRARALVHKQFSDLKDAIASEVKSLEKVKSKRQLTVEEEKLISRLKKVVDKAEYVIEKKIEKIDF